MSSNSHNTGQCGRNVHFNETSRDRNHEDSQRETVVSSNARIPEECVSSQLSAISEDDNDVFDDDIDTDCGYGPGRKPHCLRHCNNAKVLLACLCCFAAIQGFVINGILNVNTTSIERRFQLSSSRVGLISSAYDISAGILGIWISYFGSGYNKAKCLSGAIFAMAMGSFVMTIPHYVTDSYQWHKADNVSTVCSDTDVCRVNQEGRSLPNYLYLFVLGQLLHGIGGTTIYTVGIALIDDSVQSKISSMYIGFLYGSASLGPALGYILGGKMLETYVDFDTVNTDSLTITPDDPRWVGAWWVGFLISATMAMLLVVPLSCFGKELPSARHIRETRISEAHNSDSLARIPYYKPKSDTFRTIRKLPLAILELLRNPPFMLVSIAGGLDGLMIAGFATFLPKFIQNQFGTTAAWAAMLGGFIVVPGAAAGEVIGGFICNKFKLNAKGNLRLLIITTAVSVLPIFGMFARCEPNAIVGINTHFPGADKYSFLPNLTSTCNNKCHCRTDLYEPVCAVNGSQYFSPCYAGCQDQSENGYNYYNCSCLPDGTTLTAGTCGRTCDMMYVFLVLLFFFTFIPFLSSPAWTSVTLRIIEDRQKTFGLGVQLFIVRLLGTIPGPPLFGAVIDDTCLVWQESCGKRQSCWIYDNHKMGQNLFFIMVAVQIACTVLYFVAYKVYKQPKPAAEQDNNADGKPRTVSEMGLLHERNFGKDRLHRLSSAV